MKKTIIYLIASLLVIGSTNAQEDSPTTYSNFFSLTASKYEPAALGDDDKKVHVNIVNSYIWTANSTLTVGDIEAISNNELTSERINTILSRNIRTHRFGFGANLDVLNFGLYIKDSEGDDRFALSFGAGLRVEGNAFFSDNFLKLALEGNRQFAGEKVDFPLGVNVFAAREYSVGFAMPLPITLKEGLSLKAGIKAKYIEGLFPPILKMHLFLLKQSKMVNSLI